MPNPWRQRALDFNKKRKAADEKGADFILLVSYLPKGVLKQLWKIEDIAEILRKYIEEEG